MYVCVRAFVCGWMYYSKVNHKILEYMQLRSDLRIYVIDSVYKKLFMWIL